MKQFGFRDSTGQIGLGVEKLPGQWDKYLAHERAFEKTGRKEEEIHVFGRFLGRGYRFVTSGQDSFSEEVFFAPSGELEGWFLIINLGSSEPKLRQELHAAIDTLRKEK